MKNIFQANYKDTRITLTEVVPVFLFAVEFEYVLFLLGYFQGPLKCNSTLMLGKVQVTIKCSFFIVKQLLVLFEVKIRDFT